MDIVPNPWNASVITVGVDTFATNPFVAKVAIPPLGFVPNPTNAGAMWVGQVPAVKPVSRTPAVKMGIVNNLGNVPVTQVTMENCAKIPGLNLVPLGLPNFTIPQPMGIT